MKMLGLAMMIGLITVQGGVCQTAGIEPQAGSLSLPKDANLINLRGFDKITFAFEWADLTPPRWGFELGSDGVGRYYDKSSAAGENAWQDVRISPATMTLLKAGADRSGPGCETRAKHLAQTGKKVLTYWHGDAPLACTFNYSDNVAVMKVVDTFQAMADTMQYGERLQQKHRFDRLGLDAEVESLARDVKQGRAIEIQNIAPALQSIVDDERVMERVRRKAARLLQDAGSTVVSAAESPR
jgi:hypothetical protein